MDINNADEGYTLYEHYCNYYFEGLEEDEGDVKEFKLALPYIITIDVDSGAVLGIRRNWKPDDEKKRKKFVSHTMGLYLALVSTILDLYIYLVIFSYLLLRLLDHLLMQVSLLTFRVALSLRVYVLLTIIHQFILVSLKTLKRLYKILTKQ